MGVKNTSLHKVSEHRVDAKADVIFVHGLGGDYRTTWMADKSDKRTYWLGWLSEDRPDLNVWSLDYASEPSAWLGHGMAILNAAVSVLDRLSQYEIGKRPVI